MKRTLLLLAMILALPVASARAGTNEWTNAGSYGTIASLRFSPANPGVAYGIVKTTRRGEWGTLPGIDWIVRSADGGRSWDYILPLNGNWAGGFVVSASRPDTIFFSHAGVSPYWFGWDVAAHPHPTMEDRLGFDWVTDDGVMRRYLPTSSQYSTDGTTWHNLPVPYGQHTVQIDPRDARHVIADDFDMSLVKPLRYEMTTDGGATWSALPNGVYQPRFSSVNPSVVYAETAAGIVRSTDGGRTWPSGIVAAPDPIGTDRTVYWLGPGLAGATTIYRPEGASLLRSTDDGRTFVGGALPDGADPSAVSVDPATPQRLLVPSESGMNESLDAGATWHVIETAGVNTTSWTLAGSRARLYAVAGTRALRSVDQGATWAQLRDASPYRAVGVDASDDRNVALLSKNGDLHLSSDAGGTWRDVPASAIVNGGLNTSLALGASYVYALGVNSGARSNDGGATWSAISTPGGTVSLDPSNPRHLTDDPSSPVGQLYESFDGGDSWQPVLFNLTYPLDHVAESAAFFWLPSIGFDLNENGTRTSPLGRGNAHRYVPDITSPALGLPLGSRYSLRPLPISLGNERYLLGTSTGLWRIDLVEPLQTNAPEVKIGKIGDAHGVADSIYCATGADGPVPPVGRAGRSLLADGTITQFEAFYAARAVPGTTYACEERVLGPFGTVRTLRSAPMRYSPTTNDTPEDEVNDPQAGEKSARARVRVGGKLTAGSTAHCVISDASGHKADAVAWTIERKRHRWSVRRPALRITRAMAGGKVRCQHATAPGAKLVMSPWRRVHVLRASS